jgi:hypothetical protein
VGHIKHPEKAILRPWWVTFSPVWVRFMPHRFFPKIPKIYGTQNAPNPSNLAPTSSTGLPILRYDLEEIFCCKKPETFAVFVLQNTYARLRLCDQS